MKTVDFSETIEACDLKFGTPPKTCNRKRLLTLTDPLLARIKLDDPFWPIIKVWVKVMIGTGPGPLS